MPLQQLNSWCSSPEVSIKITPVLICASEWTHNRCFENHLLPCLSDHPLRAEISPNELTVQRYDLQSIIVFV